MLRIANAAEKVLKAENDFFIPVKKVYMILKKNERFKNLTLGELSRVLEADGRFSIYSGFEDYQGLSKAQHSQLAKMGYYLGPKVILKEKRPDVNRYLLGVARHIDVLDQSLKNARAKNPGESPDVATLIQEALVKVEKLKEKVQEMAKDR